MSQPDEAEKAKNAPEAQQGILIVANRPRSYESAANFLSRRGHPCSAVGNIKQAIKVVTEQKPAFVFLSWNLKNTSVQKMHTLLTKSFGKTVIVFAEATDSKTAAELTAAHFPEMMQAPVSGPGIYMKIQKIVKSREEAANGPKPSARNSSSHVEEEKEIVVSAKELPEKGEWELQGQDPNGENVWRFKSPDGKAKGNYTFKGKKPPRKNAQGSWETEENGPITFSAQKSNYNSSKKADGSSSAEGDIIAPAAVESLSDQEIEALAAQMLDSSKNAEASGAPAGAAAAVEEENEIIGAKPKPKKESSYGQYKGQDDEANEEAGSVTTYGKNKTKEDVIIQKGMGKGKMMEAEAEGRTTEEHSAVQKGPAANKYALTQEGPNSNKHSLMQKGLKPVPGKSIPPKLHGKETSSALAKSTMRALTESCNYDPKKDVIEITGVENVAVMSVKAKNYKGYLVATSSSLVGLDAVVLQSLKQKIAQYLTESGEAINSFEQVQITIEHVDFKKWSADQAEFLALSPHENEQWGLTFFPADEVRPEVVEQIDRMIAVDIEDVLPEIKLPFDLYIYFPINKKYFKYVKSGQYVQSSQRQRMQQAKVTRFYLKPEALDVFKDFCVQNQINARIEVFKKASPKKAS